MNETPAPVKREYPLAPIVGVGIIVLRGNQCLCVKRANEPGAGLWSIPGGRVELGETIEEASLRELAEECGPDLMATIRGVGLVFDRITRDDAARVRFHYVLIDTVADYISGEPVAGSDALDAMWASADELDGMRTTANLAAVVRDMLERRDTGRLP